SPACGFPDPGRAPRVRWRCSQLDHHRRVEFVTPFGTGYPTDGGPMLTSANKSQPLRLLDRFGAVAYAQFPVQRGRVFLHRMRGQVQLGGDLAVGGAGRDRLQYLAFAFGQGRPGRRLMRLEDGPAHPDRAHRLGDLDGRPVLGDEAGGAGRARRVGADAPGAGDQQHAAARVLRAQLLADLGARLLTDEQVDERDVRVVALRELQRLVVRARAQ